MTLAGRPRGDDGSAVVELVLLAVVLIVPFVYAVLCVFAVERASFAAASLTRAAGRAFVTADGTSSAHARADTAARLAADDLGAPLPAVTITCEARPCLTPGARVTVSTTTRVTLPLVPGFGPHGPPSVTVHATHVEVVDRYRAARP